ncbi:hypothetical protein STCU_10838 [Strigomonas culicis]|uniref:Secreted protein n=1 Tax=Strigomonas culicis TaxID=28005 RepID=S9TJS0_9TRYP|nr:hypothetical protein STCU_10838 [Strigomonas culicis]|eukprot:EPY17064.1 hypothetical protein STCU_10838 [Strigomonas culicis]
MGGHRRGRVRLLRVLRILLFVCKQRRVHAAAGGLPFRRSRAPAGRCLLRAAVRLWRHGVRLQLGWQPLPPPLALHHPAPPGGPPSGAGGTSRSAASKYSRGLHTYSAQRTGRHQRSGPC